MMRELPKYRTHLPSYSVSQNSRRSLDHSSPQVRQTE